MAQSRTRRAEAQAVLDQARGRRVKLMVLGATLCILLAGYAGWQLNSSLRTSYSVQVTRVFTGTIDEVNGMPGSGCIRPDGSTHHVCGNFSPTGGLVPQVGQRVIAARLIRTSSTIGDATYVLFRTTGGPY